MLMNRRTTNTELKSNINEIVEEVELLRRQISELQEEVQNNKISITLILVGLIFALVATIVSFIKMYV